MHSFSHKPIVSTILFFLFLPLCSSLMGQGDAGLPASKASKQVLEVPDDPYSPVNHKASLTSPAYTYSSPGFFTTQVNIDADGNNVLGDAANEPSLAVDPSDPSRMVIGWRHFETIFNNFRQAGIGYTSDGGTNWSFDGVINPGIFRSDPVLDADKQGNFFYNSLTVQSGDYYCDVYKSEDGGATWDFGTFAQGGDKQWFSIDKTGGEGAGNIYHYWSSASICPPYNFTRSVNNGLSYEDCSSVLGSPYWGTTAVDGSGNLYVCGFSGFNFTVSRSSTAQNGSQSMAWDYATEVNLDGNIVGFGGYGCPNPQGLLGQTIIAIDSSGGPTHDNVYLLCSVERYSTNDPCDVMFSRSTDGGLSWSAPVRVNDDIGNNSYQWFGTMSVAPDGRIDVIWLDTRESASLDSKLYYAASWDGGLSWSQNIPLGESFDPHVGWPQQDKMGDYFDMKSDETGAHLAWANTLNGEQDVYYAFISPDITGISSYTKKNSVSLDQNIPNPFRGSTTIGYTLATEAYVLLTVTDMAGRIVATPVSSYQARGRHQVTLEAGMLHEGIYYYRLQAGDASETRKLIVLD